MHLDYQTIDLGLLKFEEILRKTRSSIYPGYYYLENIPILSLDLRVIFNIADENLYGQLFF